MTDSEISELMTKGKEDGATLYRVVDVIYKITVIFNYLIGVLGVVLTFVAGTSAGFGPALAVFLATVTICAIGYGLAVFGSHGAKVLVHILFANLAILERGLK